MLQVKIIHRYIFREMASPFFASLGIITFILLLTKIMEFTELVVTKGIAIEVIFQLLFYTLPYFFVFTIPMATLLGVLLAFLRLSADNEIIALRTAGIGLIQLLPPVVLIAIFAWSLCSSLAIWALPWGNNKFESLIYQLAQSNTDLVFKERVFLNNFSGLVIYINQLSGKGYLKEIFIIDKRDQSEIHTVVAKRGIIYPIINGRVLLRLYEGTLHSVDHDFKRVQTATFESYDIHIDISKILATRTDKHEKEMYLGELLSEMEKCTPGSRQFNLLDMELQKKIALPFSCLVMALIGLPLGIHTRKGRSWGIAIALFIFFSYYIMLSAAWSFGITGFYRPRIGMWVPNIIFAFLGGLMFNYERKDPSIFLLDVNYLSLTIINRLYYLRKAIINKVRKID